MAERLKWRGYRFLANTNIPPAGVRQVAQKFGTRPDELVAGWVNRIYQTIAVSYSFAAQAMLPANSAYEHDTQTLVRTHDDTLKGVPRPKSFVLDPQCEVLDRFGKNKPSVRETRIAAKRHPLSYAKPAFLRIADLNISRSEGPVSALGVDRSERP